MASNQENCAKEGWFHLKRKPGSSKINVISIMDSVNLFTLNAVNAKFQANTPLQYSVIIIRKRF